MQFKLKIIGFLRLTVVMLMHLSLPTQAQQVNGTLGSPNATTTINGKRLPAPAPKFGGVIKLKASESTPWWAPRVVPPKGAPNVLLIMTDDCGFGSPGTFGGVIPTPALDRIAIAVCVSPIFIPHHFVHLHVLHLSPDETITSVGTGVVGEIATGYTGYNTIIPNEKRYRRRNPER